MRLFSRLFGTSKKEPVYGGMNGASSKRGFFGRKKASTISMGTPKKVASMSASSKESAAPKRRRISLQSTGKVAASIAILMSLATAITLLLWVPLRRLLQKVPLPKKVLLQKGDGLTFNPRVKWLHRLRF